MSDDDNEICPRCGQPFSEEPVPFEIEDDDDLLILPEATLETKDGTVHWDCGTLEEQRAEDFQCERCGDQYHDDGRESDAGWIVEAVPNHVLCPRCQTREENREHIQGFLDTVTRGQLNSELKGEEYPPDLAALAETLAKQLEREKDDPREETR